MIEVKGEVSNQIKARISSEAWSIFGHLQKTLRSRRDVSLKTILDSVLRAFVSV